MSGRRFLGRHDWYREGAETLVSQQDALLQDAQLGRWVGGGSAEKQPLIATSFALLFLSKGRRPVVVSKLKYGEGTEWDSHRSAVGNLTSRVESRWRRDLSWQTIDVNVAMVEDLLESPVLFISGRNRLILTPEQKENLRRYVDQGGFLFVEACCAGGDFDRDFRGSLGNCSPTARCGCSPLIIPSGGPKSRSTRSTCGRCMASKPVAGQAWCTVRRICPAIGN